MRERILCSICVSFLLLQAFVILVTGGQSYFRVPASSIFYDMEESREILLVGQVYKKTDTSKNQVLYLKNNSIYYRNNSFQESNMIVYLDKTEYQEISIGEGVKLRGMLQLFETARNPGNFDQKQYYARQNLRGYVWCEEMMSVFGEEESWREKLYQARKTWKELILEYMGEDTGGVLCAILLSEKSEMSSETKELYQKIGIGHVLAISGLHISFLGLGAYRLIRKVGVPFLVSGILAVGLLTVYVIMVGFSVSVVRAYIMLLFRILADITGRVYDILTALAFAAAVTVLYQPLSLTDAGFYLSYGAVCGIVLVKPQMEKLISQKHRWVQESMASLAINVTIFPVTLWFYYEFPTYSFVMNLIVIPLMSIVLGAGLLGSIGVLVFVPAGEICFKIVDSILQFYEWLGEIGNRLPMSTIVFGKPAWYQLFLYYVVLCALLFFLVVCKNEKILKKSRNYIWAVFGLLVLCFLKIPDGTLQVTVLDVGQGDCIFMRGPCGNTYLIDGGSSDVEQVGEYRIESFLKSQGAGVLDYVFVSHGDSDHYNGILEMLGRQQTGICIKKLVLPCHYQTDEKLVKLMEKALAQKVEVAVIESGAKITEGPLSLICVQPGAQDGDLEGNAGSMVLSVQMKQFQMLCTGDVELEGENRLCENLAGQTYDVLKVAHHGSKNSSKERLLEMIRPSIAVISVGKDNSYGHPHSETLNRFRNIGSRILMTSESGAIRLETDGEVIDIFEGCL